MKSGNELTVLRAKKFVTGVRRIGPPCKVIRHSGAEINARCRPALRKRAQPTNWWRPSAQAAIGKRSTKLATCIFSQADHQATAERAQNGQQNRRPYPGWITGSVLIRPAATTARSVAINQKSGEIQATGGVASTYFPPKGTLSGIWVRGLRIFPPPPW